MLLNLKLLPLIKQRSSCWNLGSLKIVLPMGLNIANRKFLTWIFSITAVWGIVALLFSFQLVMTTELSVTSALVRTLARWSPWILLTPIIFSFTTGFPITLRENIFKHIAVHLILSVFVALVAQLLVDVFIRPLERRLIESEFLTPSEFSEIEQPPHHPPPHPESHPQPPGLEPPFPPASLVVKASHELPRTIPIYWALMGIQSMLLFRAQLRVREREAYQLQAKLTQSQLDTLKLQLQPHFLFNALNGISTLVYRDPETADQMIGNLSKLLRGVIDEKNANKLLLSRELELLGAYISIEQMRFGDRVQFEEDVESVCYQAKVPTFFLQPLVENAVRHGLEPLGKPGTIWLKIRKDGNKLRIRIEDNGVGRQGSGVKGWGIGLSNAEARLENLYGKSGFELALDDREGGGTVVSINFPFESAQS